MVRTPEAAARSAFRKIQARVARGGLASVKVYLPPGVALYLLNEKRDDLYRLESRNGMRIEVIPQEEMKVDQFEIEEIRREESEAAPMVTADDVDQAMADGSFTPTPVVGELPPPLAAAPSPPGVRTEGGRAPSQGDPARRRRRRRGGRGRRGETGGARPGQGGDEARGSRPHAAAAPEQASGDLPVFSEGPGGAELAAAPFEPVNGNVAIASPGAAGGNTPDGQRRRRRRHGRGRGRGRGVAASGQPRLADPAAARRDDFGNRAAQDSGHRGGSSGAGASYSSSTAEPGRGTPAYAASDSGRDTGQDAGRPAGSLAASPAAASATSGDGDAGSSGEAKSKRRWWKRAFKG